MCSLILNSLKNEISEPLNTKLGLSKFGIDRVLSSSETALENTVIIETKDNTKDRLLNHFLKKYNLVLPNKFLKGLDVKLTADLISFGFTSEQALSITNLILPMIEELVYKNYRGQ